jgi:phage head maturation protease
MLIEGYFCLFDVPTNGSLQGSPSPLACEVIDPRSFARSIIAADRGEHNIKCRIDHGRCLGSTKKGNLSVGFDRIGVFASLRCRPFVGYHRILGGSIGFKLSKWKQETALLFRLTEGVLNEVTICVASGPVYPTRNLFNWYVTGDELE